MFPLVVFGYGFRELSGVIEGTEILFPSALLSFPEGYEVKIFSAFSEIDCNIPNSIDI